VNESASAQREKKGDRYGIYQTGKIIVQIDPVKLLGLVGWEVDCSTTSYNGKMKRVKYWPIDGKLVNGFEGFCSR
jgi:hypothetical protein